MKISGKSLAIVSSLIVIVLVICPVSLYFNIEERNSKYHTVNITITGKICNEEAFGTHLSEIQGSDGITYWIPNEDCSLYPIGSHGMIFYQHIEGLSMFSDSAFNRTIGDWK
jgi:hypothetical protein